MYDLYKRTIYILRDINLDKERITSFPDQLIP